MFTRRAVLKILGIFSFLFVFGRKTSMARFFSTPKVKNKPRRAQNPFTDGSASLIGVSADKSPYEMVKESVSLIGGFEKLRIKGKTALVKPNVVSGEKSPATTNPEVVSAVVKILYEHGAKKVYVGDMSALMTLSTLRNMKKNGIFDAAKQSGAEVITFEDYGWVEDEIPEAEHIKSAYVTEWIYNTDIIINLPVIKTHRSATYSITLKNFIGCTHLRQRPYLVNEEKWEELISEFNLAYTPDLNIVDGTISMIEGGPWKGTPTDTNLIIASADRVGADIVGLGVIKSFGKWEGVAGKDVWSQRQIKRAIELGVGNKRDGLRLVAGEGGSRFKELMKKVKGHTGL